MRDGRSTAHAPRSRILQVRVTDDELDAIDRECISMGLNRSDYLRQLLQNEIGF